MKQLRRLRCLVLKTIHAEYPEHNQLHAFTDDYSDLHMTTGSRVFSFVILCIALKHNHSTIINLQKLFCSWIPRQQFKQLAFWMTSFHTRYLVVKNSLNFWSKRKDFYKGYPTTVASCTRKTQPKQSNGPKMSRHSIKLYKINTSSQSQLWDKIKTKIREYGNKTSHTGMQWPFS